MVARVVDCFSVYSNGVVIDSAKLKKFLTVFVGVKQQASAIL
jgi:hypothetical protein